MPPWAWPRTRVAGPAVRPAPIRNPRVAVPRRWPVVGGTLGRCPICAADQSSSPTRPPALVAVSLDDAVWTVAALTGASPAGHGRAHVRDAPPGTPDECSPCGAHNGLTAAPVSRVRRAANACPQTSHGWPRRAPMSPAAAQPATSTSERRHTTP